MQNSNDPTLTAFKTESRIITAYNLLHCYLEFGVFVPDIENWTEEQLADNPPRLFRLKQLNSMLCAFQINDLFSFQAGLFIEQGEGLRYAQALSLISNGKISSATSDDLQQSFITFMRYRQEIEKVLWFGSGAYHIGPKLLQNTYQKIWISIETIRKEIVIIDQIIAAIVSPEEKSFSIETLVRDYGFPEVDITELDMNFL